jgi:hypothetical protein
VGEFPTRLLLCCILALSALTARAENVTLTYIDPSPFWLVAGVNGSIFIVGIQLRGLISDGIAVSRVDASGAIPNPASPLLAFAMPAAGRPTEDHRRDTRYDPAHAGREPGLGAPMIHGELQKLGLVVSEGSVARYATNRE